MLQSVLIMLLQTILLKFPRLVFLLRTARRRGRRWLSKAKLLRQTVGGFGLIARCRCWLWLSKAKLLRQTRTIGGLGLIVGLNSFFKNFSLSRTVGVDNLFGDGFTTGLEFFRIEVELLEGRIEVLFGAGDCCSCGLDASSFFYRFGGDFLGNLKWGILIGTYRLKGPMESKVANA